MNSPIQHPHENASNTIRAGAACFEPRASRTYTPSQAVLARSAGAFHWTPEGRRLYDFTSGVLVANLGHNSATWMKRFKAYMGWDSTVASKQTAPEGYFLAPPTTAYNAVTGLKSKRRAAWSRDLTGSARWWSFEQFCGPRLVPKRSRSRYGPHWRATVHVM